MMRLCTILNMVLSLCSSQRDWRVELLNKKSSSIPSLVKNGYTATTDSDKATMLNGFFSECFNTAQPPLSINQEEPLSYLESSNFESIDDLLCTEDEL